MGKEKVTRRELRLLHNVRVLSNQIYQIADRIKKRRNTDSAKELFGLLDYNIAALKAISGLPLGEAESKSTSAVLEILNDIEQQEFMQKLKLYEEGKHDKD